MNQALAKPSQAEEFKDQTVKTAKQTTKMMKPFEALHSSRNGRVGSLCAHSLVSIATLVLLICAILRNRQDMLQASHDGN
jgi:hypothetical protein